MREYRFILDCEVESPLCVSSGTESDLTDAALRRRADGTLVIAGTSVAGALRAVVERLTGDRDRCLLAITGGARRGATPEKCGCATCELFGDVRPGAEDAVVSKVTVFDVSLEGADVEIADGVALERSRKTAAERRKFDFEQVIPGARCRVEIRARAPSDEQLAWLGAALRLLGEGRVPLGGRTARGCGTARALRQVVQWRDLSAPDHLIASLLTAHDDDAGWPGRLEQLPGVDLTLADEVVVAFRIELVPEATFLVADPEKAVETGFDHAPRGGPDAPELPASALRGALRSGAERILRTLRAAGACDPTDRDQSCAFRERGARQQGQPFSRCPACRLFGNEEYASRLRVHVRPVVGIGSPAPFDHVAIDRFTGGASEGRKFDTLASRTAAYDVQCTLAEVSDQDRPWMLGLLALALQDLADGRIHVGFGAARGQGQFRFASPPVFSDLPGCVAALWRQLGLEPLATRETSS